MKYRIFLSLIVLGIISLIVIKLNAQGTPKGLMVVPSNFELSINPGEEVIKTITLKNLTDSDLEIKANTRNFTAQGEEGEVVLTSAVSGYSLAQWIEVSPKQTAVAKGQEVTFTFKIRVPKNAEPGGHFGSVVLGTIPNKTLTQTGATISQEIGSLILVKIPGEVTEKATLESFNTDKLIYTENQVSFDSRVRNESTVHIRPSGTIAIKDIFGHKWVIEANSLNVLPGAIRKAPTAWTENLLIGQYTAQLSLFYGATNQNLIGQTVFYAFPVKPAAIVLAILIILYLMRKRLFKSLKALIAGK